jgi:hypothetical protein
MGKACATQVPLTRVLAPLVNSCAYLSPMKIFAQRTVLTDKNLWMSTSTRPWLTTHCSSRFVALLSSKGV